MIGTEYELGKCLPPKLFIIHKQVRNSFTSGNIVPYYYNYTNFSLVSLIASYYVLDGCIYQSPSLYSTLSHRILSSMSYLQSAIEYADRWLEFDPTKSRHIIKIPKESSINSDADVNMEKEPEKVTLPDKDNSNFVTQINSRFMNLP